MLPMKTRKDKLMGSMDLASAFGAEIGPLGRPVVSRTDGNIIYIDYADTQTLRNKYASDPNVDESLIEVDAVWGQHSLLEAISQCPSIQKPVQLDYVIASHVIEHVPDLITWLQEIRSVLKPGGEVRLAIPDKRYTFDCLRRTTDVASVLTAYLQKARIPNTQCLLDFCLHEVPVSAIDAWAGKLDEEELRKKHPHTLEGAMAVATDALLHGNYHDIHCWVFTPASFATLMEVLAQHDLVHFGCAAFHTTEFNEIEFFVALRLCEDPQERTQSWRNMSATITELERLPAQPVEGPLDDPA